MKSVQDFNYKVALASGLKHLQGKRLRQAEEQFRYLTAKFPRADGGYRGLARVYVELGDKAAALGTLREGAAALTKGGDRGNAIELLKEAVALDPLDLAAHRRLAAAFSLAGDPTAASNEYMRFIQLELSSGDPERAKLEAMYALETLGEIPALHAVAQSVGLPLRTVRGAAAPAQPSQATAPTPQTAPAAVDPRAELLGASATPTAAASAPEPAIEETTLGGLTAAQRAELFGSSKTDDEDEEWKWKPSQIDARFDAEVDPRAALLGGAATPTAPAPAPAKAPAIDPLVLEERAMALIANKDPNSGKAAIEAATALAAAGKTHAASDLLLALVASGNTVHDAERVLVSVGRTLGRDDLADERDRLLAEAVRLAQAAT